MKLLILALLIGLVSCNVKEIDDLIVPSDVVLTPSAPKLTYYNPASSPSNKNNPEFKILNSSGGEQFFMTTIRVFADGNCTTQITSAYINSMQTNIRLQLTLTAEGTFTFTANYTDMFGDTSKCSSPLTYKYQTTALKTFESDDELNHAQIIFDEEAETLEASDTL